jgi:hypothetical protein
VQDVPVYSDTRPLTSVKAMAEVILESMVFADTVKFVEVALVEVEAPNLAVRVSIWSGKDKVQVLSAERSCVPAEEVISFEVPAIVRFLVDASFPLKVSQSVSVRHPVVFVSAVAQVITEAEEPITEIGCEKVIGAVPVKVVVATEPSKEGVPLLVQ